MKSDMILRTTVNIEINLLNDLKKKCKEKDLSVAFVIKKSVKLYLDVMKKDDFKGTTLTYQPKGPTYKKFHIKLKSFEYDVYSDAKKVSRLSFSHIVGIALERYADLVINGGDTEVDTYPLYAYTKYCMIDDNCTYYAFSWGISRNEVKITLPPVVEISS
jgi:hypothetical protein